MSAKVSIVWFRNDLRLHDNEALTEAIHASDTVIPVFIFDDRVFGAKTKYGFDKTGRYRSKFILESVIDLKAKLQACGSDLIVLKGKTEDLLTRIVTDYKANWIFCNRERTDEESKVQDALEQQLWSIGREIRYSRGKMLYYTADLPFPVTHTPDQFTTFRKEVEKIVEIRKPLETPCGELTTFDILEEYDVPLPKLIDLGFEEFKVDKGLYLKGGETAALEELNYYFWEEKLAGTYKEHRNELLGRDFSTKFSAYLAQGCISPKLIYHTLKKYESISGSNESTYWIFFELLWRDFFRLQAKKHGNHIFQRGGTQQKFTAPGSGNRSDFNKWAEGRTGEPFVDANMRELNATGYMSNRGRQNVASYLIQELGVNWVMGAEYFESLLIDYDPCSNYGNWNYIAGVGASREEKHFNVSLQAKKYDPKNNYVEYWLSDQKDPKSV